MIELARYSHPGPRENLEDACHAVSVRLPGQSEVVIAVLADGVGGRNSGEVASELAVLQMIVFLFTQLGANLLGKKPSSDQVVTLLKNVFEHVNRAVLKAAAEHPRRHGMATTAVCFIILDGRLYVAWRGDWPSSA
jgi:PPM family protein phosphatase